MADEENEVVKESEEDDVQEPIAQPVQNEEAPPPAPTPAPPPAPLPPPLPASKSFDRRGPSIQPPTLDQLPVEEEQIPEKPLTRWEEWCQWVEKNGKPKIYEFKKEPLPKGRWAKSPMTEEDWEEFDSWAKKRSKPVEELDEPEPPKRKKVPLDSLKKNIEKLSKPKFVTKPYVFKKEEFNFIPAIKHGQPPRKEKPRKLKKPVIRRCFPDVELESEFWRFTFRLDINPPALKHVTTEHDRKLSIPKKYPPDPHCPLPPEEPIPIRIRMTYIEWIWHLRRLVYLAAPKERLDPPVEKGLPRGKKKPLRKFQPRLGEIAKPKKYPPYKENDPGVKKSALTANASARTKKLAEPTHKRQKYKPEKDGTGVKKSALSYKASGRIKEMSKPKKYPEEEKPKKGKRKKREKLNEKCYL